MGTHYGIRPQGNTPFNQDRLLMYDFVRNIYSDTNSTRQTFENAVNFSRASNATMVDSDGLIKWAPHNLWQNSENITSARNGTITEIGTLNNAKTYRLEATSNDAALITYSIRVNSGETWTIEVWLRSPSGSLNTKISLGSGFPSGSGGRDVPVTATSEWQKFTVTATAISTGTAFHPVGGYNGLLEGDIVEISAPRVYRSDLGGMVNNPNPLDPIDPTYVPTTNGSRYLPRIGHHVYDGSAWVNEGLLVESTARTNLIENSNSPSTGNLSVANSEEAAPDGSALKLYTKTSEFGNINGTPSGGFTPNTTYTLSAFVKAGNFSTLRLQTQNVDGLSNSGPDFDLISGTSSSGATHTIQEFPNGIWRVSYTFTTGAAASSGSVRVVPANGTGLGDSFYLFGLQLEEGSTPSSYIPTNGSTATRAAESATISESLFGPEQNNEGITIVSDIRILFENAVDYPYGNSGGPYSWHLGYNANTSSISYAQEDPNIGVMWPITLAIDPLPTSFKTAVRLIKSSEQGQIAVNGEASTIQYWPIPNTDNIGDMGLGNNPNVVSGRTFRSIKIIKGPTSEERIILESTL